MKKQTVAIMAFVAMLPAFAHAADLKKALKQAYETKNEFVVQATLQAAQAQNPKLAEELNAYLAELKNPPVEKPALVQTEGWQAYTSGWKGSVAAGIKLQSGNTEEEDVSLSFKAVHDATKWRTKIAGEAEYGTSNGTRTDEAYTLNGRIDRKLDEKRFIFAEADAERDLFSGYDYRISENVGYGRTFAPWQNTKLDLLLGVGGRHSETTGTNPTTSHEAIIKPAAEFVWQVREGLEFSQTAESTIGQEFTATEAETALKTQLMKQWFLKTSFQVEHVSDVPAGSKNTDTTTSVNLVYDF